MSKYHFNEIERKWQKYWAENKTFAADNRSEKPKYYVLDMFPYPSGVGLHVGHPLGYIASDIYARYMRHRGYNVLHPMGYDSFGLPAEQYAIQTGQHPAKTTEENIARYREQLDKIGFSFDWDREVRTSDPEYYRWTQWIFLQLFDSWYDKEADKARSIEELRIIFSSEGNSNVKAASDDDVPVFTAQEWLDFDKVAKEEILLKYRLTYLADTEVNWCAQLGTVLANDEIVNGVSERGGYPVVRKKMKQWIMRISAYAQRLLDDLNKIDWPLPLKESQTNWIGRSEGAEVTFNLLDSGHKINVFTTRPDTIFGVSFMVLAPEHDLVLKITTEAQKQEVRNYIDATAKRSERDRMADVKNITGVFTGAYAIHPFTGENIPVWIGDYVLAGYGTGAVMSVPAGDRRDYDFAKQFNLPVPNIFEGIDDAELPFAAKSDIRLENSDFLNGLEYQKAVAIVIQKLEEKGIGRGKISFRMRDAVFSRQRYWGEPFPIYYQDGMPQAISEKYLPLRLPEVEKYLPTEEGEPPLGRADIWAWDTEKNEVVSNNAIDNITVFPLELNTMPGWAGSSWYFFRYMEEKENRAKYFASKGALDYWQDVDLYIGGSEHATGHLLYSRFWVKFLFDRNLVPVDEPFKKLINQGMILGESAFIYRVEGEEKKKFVSAGRAEAYNTHPLHVNVDFVDGHNQLNIKALVDSGGEFADATFELENGEIYVGKSETFKVSREVEKMSKSKFNVVNPDAICDQYGADTLRMYEMFLGPLEQAKPWNTAGITGVHGFLKKLWKLYHSGENETFFVVEKTADTSKEGMKILHKTIKKVQEDIDGFSFNTSVSTFMIAVNELTAAGCYAREILEPLLILISPYAPHIAEELWEKLGHTESISKAAFPIFDEKYLVENEKNYPISFNGKMRFNLNLPASLSKEEIEAAVMSHDKTARYLEGASPKKIIVVPGKIVNIVI
ncbi:MAG TPA: leucine--tRNA ligase [Flavobacteriaceae bacterium]|nr:leucine--tRNA ligase [Flavobacteriaceae bacterium]